MKPSTALEQHLEEVKKAVLTRKTCNARIFGSVLRGTDTEESDLDILVNLLPGATLFELGALQVDLEEILGIPVDLLTPGELPEKFREQVLNQARAI